MARPPEEKLKDVVEVLQMEAEEQSGFFKLLLKGPSMEPMILSGDVVFVEKAHHQPLRFGEIYAYQSGDYRVVHRYLGGFGSLKMKADNGIFFDPPVASQALLGRIFQIQRQEKKLHLKGFFARCFQFIIGALSYLEAIYGLLFWRVLQRLRPGASPNRANRFIVSKIVRWPKFLLIKAFYFFMKKA